MPTKQKQKTVSKQEVKLGERIKGKGYIIID